MGCPSLTGTSIMQPLHPWLRGKREGRKIIRIKVQILSSRNHRDDDFVKSQIYGSLNKTNTVTSFKIPVW